MPRAQSAQSWKKPVAEGIKSFRLQDFDGAFKSLDEAVRLANDESYVVYDTRASFYEKQNCFNHALRDARKTIDIAPEKWHGYLRSARLLAGLGQSDAALDMCSQARAHIGDGLRGDPRLRELRALRQHLETRKCSGSRIPVELLLVIFKHSGNPGAIALVCRRWREMALSQPTFWGSLALTAPVETAVQKLNEWHRRSHGRIVEFTLRESLFASLYSRKGHPNHSALYTDIMAALQHLDFTGLQKIHVERNCAWTYMQAMSEGILRNADRNELPWENLRAFSVTSGLCHWSWLAAAMHHLTSLEYKIYIGSAGKDKDFYKLVRANPGLEKLVIEVVLRDYEFPTPQEPLTLANLRHLEMRGAVPFRIGGGNFSLPALQVLRVTWLNDAALQLTELMEDAGTSFAELTELTTSCGLLGPEILTAILLRAPKLRTLNCAEMDVVVAESLSKPCTALLSSSSGSGSELLVPTELPILCPALSTCNFSWSPKLTTDLVVQIVKARIALATASQDSQHPVTTAAGDDDDDVVSCIRTLKIDACPLIDPEMLPWFEEHVPDRCTCRFGKERMQPRRGRTRSVKLIVPSHYF